MNYNQAKELAPNILKIEFQDCDFNVIVDEDNSMEFSRGWLFAYNIDSFVLDPLSEDFLITTRPIVVDKKEFSLTRIYDCDIVFTGVEDIINYYLKSKEKS